MRTQQYSLTTTDTYIIDVNLYIRRIGSPAVSDEADGCGGSAERAVVGGMVPEGVTVVSVGTSTSTQCVCWNKYEYQIRSIIYKSINK